MDINPSTYQLPRKTYRSAEHLVYSCQYHVIFCPKYRRPVLTDPIDGRLKEILLSVAEDYGFRLPSMEVMPDHVHLLVDCNPRFGIMECVKRLKGVSAHILREEFPQLKTRLPSLWTRSCFISSVGCVSLETVKQYIEEQKNR